MHAVQSSPSGAPQTGEHQTETRAHHHERVPDVSVFHHRVGEPS